jgi:hypothetical protein
MLRYDSADVAGTFQNATVVELPALRVHSHFVGR